MLIRLAIAWMLGIVAADVLRPAPLWLWAAAAAGLVITIAVRFTSRHMQRPVAVSRHGFTIGLCLVCAAAGGLRYSGTLPVFGPQSVASLIGQGELRLSGAVASDPRRSEDGQRVVLQVETLLENGVGRPVEGLALLVLPPYPAYRYGDRLEVRGALERPRSAERPGEFDYRAYLGHRAIFALMREPAVRRLPGERGLAPLAALLRFREHCRAVLLRELPEPQAALAVGILLGIQSSIPDEVYSAFSATGTSHILVVSGWNFTIVAGVLAAITTRLQLGRGRGLALALAAMWAYALLTGFSAAVLRAAAMASLAAIGRAAERRSEPWRLLFAACWGISLADPHTLWDLGFQLSALATASLFAFARPVEGWVKRWRPLAWPVLAPLTEAFTATMAAQVLTLPLILYGFGNLSIVAPLANVLLVPVVPYAMALGTAALLAGLVWLPLGQWLAVGAWLPLSWLAEGARLLAAPRWAAVQIPPFPLWVLLAYYVLVAVLWLRAQRRVGEPTDAVKPAASLLS